MNFSHQSETLPVLVMLSQFRLFFRVLCVLASHRRLYFYFSIFSVEKNRSKLQQYLLARTSSALSLFRLILMQHFFMTFFLLYFFLYFHSLQSACATPREEHQSNTNFLTSSEKVFSNFFYNRAPANRIRKSNFSSRCSLLNVIKNGKEFARISSCFSGADG